MNNEQVTHKVVTVPRQGGFAARCTCGGITFGGFNTRGDAALALGDCLAESNRNELERPRLPRPQERD